ncbi:hypothetical protein B0A50_02192 [Salinomyces thailandicus]|uniref:Uncharacterized protein n=1 Tax=Salinomyces thailandicus TaxID=706561 RepID=A0A4U0U8G6_9PEZI|nr:hypothetical protein B0A50_02192 [Salinomyces thailandica]
MASVSREDLEEHGMIMDGLAAQINKLNRKITAASESKKLLEAQQKEEEAFSKAVLQAQRHALNRRRVASSPRTEAANEDAVPLGENVDVDLTVGRHVADAAVATTAATTPVT